ncbi:MAG: PadR family transcriptional regulator [bacterium]
MFRFLILGLLRSGMTQHGYALVKEYRERSGAEVSTGNFYRELQRLVLDGLIRAAANPPGSDNRRTPYEITQIGAEVFDEWLTAQGAGGGDASEDEISARALFAQDTEPALMLQVLERLQENLWFAGKSLERARQQALTRAAAPAGATRFSGLPMLLSRRMKHIAIDLEFVDDFRVAYEHWLTARAPVPVATVEPVRARAARRREPAGTARRPRRAAS